ncbi:hypothetical protein LPJ66_007876 [Kickxella alabastrina]|uniref:Uncharacterized protein n=1 Tax=Kickxella alabastrina TaxID=61397 RepID=A0ACC1IA51_9FUNG|nr:hypothetical protein LPJ66_007876 [Kickxella alabastrina]
MDANVLRAERTLTHLSTIYLANTDAVTANIALVVDTILAQNLFAYLGKPGITMEIANKYTVAVNKWVQRINSMTREAKKSSETRFAGALLMKHTALQSPLLLLDNATEWTSNLLNIISKTQITPVYQASLQTLLVFMDIVREVPALHRDIASAKVPQMNLTILDLAEKNPDLVDTVLEILMCSASWFPTLFRPSIDKTEALCLRILSGAMSRPNPQTCTLAAQCLASLSTAGGKMAVEERWYDYARKAMGTIESCIDHLMFNNAMQADSKDCQSRFQLPPFADNFTVSIPQAVDRITSMSDLLIALLTRPFSVDLPIPADALVALASKLALVPMRVANSKSSRTEFSLIPMLTPEIQRASIRILATMSMALGNYMLPYLSAVARTVAVINTRQIASPATQVALYKLIQLYVEAYDYGFVVFLPKEVLELAISDISVQSKRQTTAITATSQASALSSSGSRKRGGNGRARTLDGLMTDDDIQASLVHWTDVVLAALETIMALFRHTPTAISSTMRTQLDGQILTLLMLDMVGSYESPFACRQTDTPYKVALYKCLQASVVSPDPWHRAILPHALTTFTAGLADSSPEVRSVCTQALDVIELMMHARLPAQLRAPDSEENVEAEGLIAGSIFSDEATIDAALTGMLISEGADFVESETKRFKQSSALKSHAATAVENAPTAVHVDFSAASSVEAVEPEAPAFAFAPFSPQTALPADMPTAPAAAPASIFTPKPTVTPITPKPAPAQTKQAPKKPAAPVDEGDDNDNVIPDIVMEGSDSEDDEEL